ncbi:MAG: VCBS repeat-containing protein [Planctomycetes bacterium]|nr:VCBS repeat-containing protein [Planctomycetota bacterium]
MKRFLIVVSAFLLSTSAFAQLAPYDAAQIRIGGRDARFRHLLDRDGDGDLDAVGWEQACGVVYGNPSGACHYRIALYDNPGNGALVPSFTESFSLYLNPQPTNLSMVVGDLGIPDGRDEFLLSMDASVYAWPSAAYPTSGSHVFTLPSTIVAMAVSDFDGDGDGDLMVLDATGVLRPRRFPYPAAWPGAGLTAIGPSVSVGITASARLLVSDLDGDGDDDYGIATNSQLRVVWNVSGAGLVLGPSFTAGQVGSAFADGDIDGDGDVDLVAFGPTTFSVIRNNGAGSFTVENSVAGGPATHLADVDGDGDLDGVCCGGGGGIPISAYYNTQVSDFQVALNNGSGLFAPSFKIPGLGAERLAGAADMDGDGDMDLVAGRCVWFQDGAVADPREPAPFAAPIAADLLDDDGDGDLEYRWTPAAVTRNNGDGTFASRPVTILGTPAGGSYLGPGYPGDFDGDGVLDRVVELSVNGSFVDLRLLRGQGGGLYLDDGTTFIGAGIQASIYTALDGNGGFTVDADLDGDLDLVTHATTSAALWSHVWLNDGNGHTVPNSISNDFIFEGAADFDDDGLMEVIAADSYEELWVFREQPGFGILPSNRLRTSVAGLPMGALGSLAFRPGSFHPLVHDLVVEDLTGDGRPDILAVDFHATGTPASTVSYTSDLYLLEKDAVGPGFTAHPPLGLPGVLPKTKSSAGEAWSPSRCNSQTSMVTATRTSSPPSTCAPGVAGRSSRTWEGARSARAPCTSWKAPPSRTWMVTATRMRWDPDGFIAVAPSRRAPISNTRTASPAAAA